MDDRRHNTISESTTFVLGIVDDIFASVFSKIDERPLTKVLKRMIIISLVIFNGC